MGSSSDRVHNLPIGDIIEDVQKVKEKDRSLTYEKKMRESELYLDLVERMVTTSEPDERAKIENELNEMERRFQDPALEALMKIERLTRQKRAD